MKIKFLSSLIVGAMAISMGSTIVVAKSVTVDVDGGSGNHDVSGTYHIDGQPAIVYSVEVQWGSMEFSYNAGNVTKIWNPKTHAYDTSNENARWEYTDGANKITLSNSSNADVSANVEASINESYANQVQVFVNKTQLTLPDASIGATTQTPGTKTTDSAEITLTGELDESMITNKAIGKVTVIIDQNTGGVTNE